MAMRPLADMVCVSTQTSGTGTYEIGASPDGWLSPFVELGTGTRTVWRCVSADGAMWELFEGVISAGSPATITRETVLRNYQGTTSAVNWPSNAAKLVYLVQPASRIVQPEHQAWRVLQDYVIPASVSGYAATLPAGYDKFRLEWFALAPVSVSGLYARVGVTSMLYGASDYPQSFEIQRGGADYYSSTALSYVSLSEATVGGNTGWLEFEAANTRYFNSHNVNYVQATGQMGRCDLFGQMPGAPSRLGMVSMGFVGVNMQASGRIRLLGGFAL